MPSAPKLRYAHRLIWRAEIERQFDAERAAHADGDVGIAREIKIYLRAVAQQREQSLRAAIAGRIVENKVVELRQIVGHHRLFQQSFHHQKQSGIQHRGRDAAVALQLRKKLRRTHNRSGHKHREICEIKHIVEHTPRSDYHATVDIDHITDRAERVERDAHRNNDVCQPEVCTDNRCHRLHHSPVTLKPHKHSHRQQDTANEQCPTAAATADIRQPYRQPIVDHGFDKHRQCNQSAHLIGKQQTECHNKRHHCRPPAIKQPIDWIKHKKHQPESLAVKKCAKGAGYVGEPVNHQV